MNFKEARAKAEAIVNKQKRIKYEEKVENKPKHVKVDIPLPLPKLEKTKVNEQDIGAYMKVLRKTNTKISQAQQEITIARRAKAKQEKKLKNVNYLKETLTRPDKDHSVRQRIRSMRQNRVFPQPKSNMNHRKAKGILKKNSIKINKD